MRTGGEVQSPCNGAACVRTRSVSPPASHAARAVRLPRRRGALTTTSAPDPLGGAWRVLETASPKSSITAICEPGCVFCEHARWTPSHTKPSHAVAVARLLPRPDPGPWSNNQRAKTPSLSPLASGRTRRHDRKKKYKSIIPRPRASNGFVVRADPVSLPQAPRAGSQGPDDGYIQGEIASIYRLLPGHLPPPL